MLRIIVCSAILIAFIAGLKYALGASLEAFGLWPYLAICVVVGGAGIFISHLIDRADTRSQEEPPPKRRDYR